MAQISYLSTSHTPREQALFSCFTALGGYDSMGEASHYETAQRKSISFQEVFIVNTIS